MMAVALGERYPRLGDDPALEADILELSIRAELPWPFDGSH